MYCWVGYASFLFNGWQVASQRVGWLRSNLPDHPVDHSGKIALFSTGKLLLSVKMSRSQDVSGKPLELPVPSRFWQFSTLSGFSSKICFTCSPILSISDSPMNEEFFCVIFDHKDNILVQDRSDQNIWSLLPFICKTRGSALSGASSFLIDHLLISGS